MKALQIALLVIAGALAGAAVMRVLERPQIADAPLVAAQVERAATPTVQPVEPAPVAPMPTEAATPRSVPEPQPIAPAETRQAVRSIRERLAVRPSNATRSSQAPRERAPVSKVERAEVAVASAPPPRDTRSLILEIARARVEEPRAPAPLPPVPPEVSQTSQTPPARTEPENVTPVPPPLSVPHRVTLNAGMLIPVRLVDGLSTERSRVGDVFIATLDQELVANDFVIAERGARVEGRVVRSDSGGKTAGGPDLAVELVRLHTSDGQSVPIRTESFSRHGDPSSPGDGRVVAGGGVVRSGDGNGGTIWTGGVWLNRGKPVTLPSATRIPFRLETPVSLTERTQ